MKCPCDKKCADREATCHTSCEKYKVFREKYETLKKKNGRSMPIRIPNSNY